MAKTTLKSLLEGYAWERTPGKALPTLADVVAAHNAKTNLQEADMMTINDFNSIFETFYTALEENAKFMDIDSLSTLKVAIKILQKAQAQEAVAHGVNFTKRPVNLS
jgi:hypothetical protein